ncbi:peptidoglycan-binding domain-containing protein [Streptomyces sp. 3214.6]|uniref:peptidoglycan-binding domain-containing protein n=1 Tax=Streptomyces sp. 3214.6 TaxID=1882757 RepID=UPI00090BD30D|nr:peptidoglycan-binding domain-containing protein [Streptomyces sp. 3214.6]SHI05361.1 Putative peptidoglycan binding domain-containing protein [Streptomyces sp. 3214.6]
MSEPQGGVCPLCGAPRAADGTPGCACARLASDAHRTARTTEAAAAEDFDPVRIRPFVMLGDDDQGPQQDGPGSETTAAPTVTTSPEPVEPPPSKEPEESEEFEEPEEFEKSAEGGGSEARPDVSDGPRPNRRRLHLPALAGALAAAVTAAGLAAVLLYEAPEREGSSAEGVRAPVPEVTSGAASPAGPTSAQASRTQPSSPTASGSPSPASPTPEAPTRSAVAPSAPSTGTASASPSARVSTPLVLRLGDSGPQVVELQLRLRQIGYYGGAADGEYGRQVESSVRTYQLTRAVLQDESGVYGAATRASLEAETDEP